MLNTANNFPEQLTNNSEFFFRNGPYKPSDNFSWSYSVIFIDDFFYFVTLIMRNYYGDIISTETITVISGGLKSDMISTETIGDIYQVDIVI